MGSAVAAAHEAYLKFRQVPAPHRGAMIRAIGEAARQRTEELAHMITMEVGKPIAEARGEVQEWIDMCDLACGLSRQLHGLTLPSERRGHRLMELWQPLGVTGIISAFNFPMAVWSWNAMLALVCGNAVVWKPSEKATLCACLVHELVMETLKGFPDIPNDILTLCPGDSTTGMALAAHPQVALLSATGSTAMGRAVAPMVASRLGRCLLELGGNNAAIVTPSASLERAAEAIVFAATGTAGQRCTTLRRLYVHHGVADELIQRLVYAYGRLIVGDPRLPGTTIGPLIDQQAGQAMQQALDAAQAQGGIVLCGGERLTQDVPSGCYVRPALVAMPTTAAIVAQETFAPILYVMTYDSLDEAIAMQNSVSQGLSAALFSDSLMEVERFIGPAGADCGLLNINIGTSGAEIGIAFGGEKATGGGREAGSDSWKAYMRRVSCTLSDGAGALELAQGIPIVGLNSLP